nr:MAG TPA: structural protein [Caudoviricetes sp.]
MALKQANTLAPANTSATGFALGDARHIGGHRVVASLDALIKLQDWQLLNPGETDTALALGQEWYVKGSGHYRLVSWNDRKATSGWRKVVDPNTIDTTLFQIVSDLPTTGINKNKIYLLLSERAENKNVYAEYLYTGDTSSYDASKWEKLGEAAVKIIVDTALSDTSTNPVQNKVVKSGIDTVQTNLNAHTNNKENPHGVTKDQVGLGNVTNEAQIPWTDKGANNGVAALDGDGHVKDSHLWDASEGFHGLISADDWKRLDDVYGVYDSKTLGVKEGAIPTSAYGVVKFDGMTSGETVNQGASVTRGKIMFNTTKKCFVEVVGSTQYGAFEGSNKYGNPGLLTKPTAGKIYSMGTSLYMLDAASGDLVLINGRIDETYINTLF